MRQSAAGYGQQRLTTTGCSLEYFEAPTDQFPEVGVDIAPGKWNLKRGSALNCNTGSKTGAAKDGSSV